MKSLNRCIENFTESLTSTIKDSRAAVYYGKTNSIPWNYWRTSYLIPFWGRIYSLSNYSLSNKDYLKIEFEESDNDEYSIEFHDKNYFVEKSEQFKDFPRHTMVLKSGLRYTGFLDITLHVLLPEVSNCKDDDDYSFLECTRVCTYVDKINFIKKYFRHG